MAIYLNNTTIKRGNSGIPIINEGESKPEQTKTATPSLSQQTISSDSGYVLSGVTVEPITSTLLTSLDSDFKAENIAEGVDMFGVVGTHASGEVSSGFSVTFPATANNWDKILNYATLVLSDGSTIDFTDYSVVAGRTINNVIDIRASADSYYLLSLTLTAGAIVVAHISGGTALSADRTEAPGSTPFYYASHSSNFSFMPMEDITISAIDLVYTYD